MVSSISLLLQFFQSNNRREVAVKNKPRLGAPVLWVGVEIATGRMERKAE